MIKTINSIQYHVWSDALHARELARQSKNAWDRGAYVRWTIQTAWSAFENVCSDALAAEGLGNRFKKNFDEAVARAGLVEVDWGRGIWQKVLQVYNVRKEFVHVVPGISHERLKTPLEEAEKAIRVLREAIKAVSVLVGLPDPPWVEDDSDRGWDGLQGGANISANLMVTRAGVRDGDPANVRICYVLKGREYVSEIALPDTPHGPLLDKMVASLTVPVDAVRAYCGDRLVEERFPPVR